MTRQQGQLRRAGAALVAFAAVLSLAACQGFLADNKIKKIEAKVDSIRNFKPSVHKPEAWDSATQQLASVKVLKTTDPAAANTQAEQLLGQVDTLVTEVKAAHATALSAEAETMRQVMDKNDGKGLDPQRHQEILDLHNRGKQSLANQTYDTAIQEFNDVVNNVEQVLLPLRQAATTQLNELQSERRQMDTFGANEFAPEFVTEVEQIILRVQELINNERDYLQARTLAQRGKTRAQEGITKANKIRAELEISKLEQRLRKAREEGAEIYCASQLNQATSTFDTIIQSFFQNQFEQVLSTIQILRPTVDALIFCTLESSARDKLNQLNQGIQRHVHGGVEEYLPGRVERLRERVESAQADFDVASREPALFPTRPDEVKAEIELAFEKIKRDIRDAFILSEKIDAAFDDLAATALRDAEFELNVAQELFNKMEGAFIEPASAVAGSPLEFQIGYNREAFKSELKQRLFNTRVALDEAKIARDEDRYRKAIEDARIIETEAQALQGQVYKVVAENALVELEGQISRFTREGAAEFAATDLALTRALADEAKALMSADQYKNAVEQAARARAQLDVTLQVLGREVLERVQSARLAIEASEELRAGQYAPETVGRARGLLDQAQTQLSALAYRRAYQLAEQSAQTAREARAEAGLAWSRSELDAARDARMLAESAEAIGYAPLLMRRAQDQYSTALTLRDEGADYAAAALTAQEAAKSFRDATYKRIDEANEAILSARRSEGWKYEQRELTKAIVRAEEAEEVLLAGAELAKSDPRTALAEFDRSRALAEQGRVIAEEVREASQRAGVQERLTRIQNALQDASRTGANYFQVAEVKRLLKETEKVKASLGYRAYEDAVEALNRIDAEFESVLNSTPDRVGKMVERLRSKLSELEAEADANSIAPSETREARERLNYVTIDFDEGNFARAYGNLQGAIRAVEAVEARVAERAYQIEITRLFRELNEALVRFDAIIKLGPDTLRRVAYGIDGRGRAVAISNAMPPTEFKEIVDDIYLTVIGIEPPPSRASLHKRVVRVVEEARLAAAEFQKILIFDELDRAAINDTIKSAYKHHNEMVKQRSEVLERMLDAGADLDVVREEQVRPFERSITAGI
jgi:hypothetical protein